MKTWFQTLLFYVYIFTLIICFVCFSALCICVGVCVRVRAHVRFLLLQCYSAYVQKRASSFSAFSTFSVVMDTHTEYVTIVLSVIDSLSWDVVTSLDRRDFFGHSEFFLI